MRLAGHGRLKGPVNLQDPLKSAPMSARNHISVSLLLLTLLTFAASGTPARAATLPPGFVETQIASGLDQPTAISMAPDGRLFVCEKKGRLRIIKNGALLPTPFLKVTVIGDGERGLLGVTFDPDFEHNGYVYIYYTVRYPKIHNRISRFTADGDQAVPGSEKILIELPQLSTYWHNSGTLRFGPDGKLYASVGENYIAANSQTLANPLGKILRLNRDGSIPADNPFYSPDHRHRAGDLGPGAPQPLQLHLPARHRTDVHQRRRQTSLGGDQRGRGGSELRLAGGRGAVDRSAVPRPPLRLPARQRPREGVLDHRRRLLRSGGRRPSRRSYKGNYFFSDYCNGWIRRLDPGDGETSPFASGIAFSGGPDRGRRRQPLLPGAPERRGLPDPLHREPGAVDHGPAGGPEGGGRRVA